MRLQYTVSIGKFPWHLFKYRYLCLIAFSNGVLPVFIKNEIIASKSLMFNPLCSIFFEYKVSLV